MRHCNYPQVFYGTYPNLIPIESYEGPLELEKEALRNGTNLNAC